MNPSATHKLVSSVTVHSWSSGKNKNSESMVSYHIVDLYNSKPGFLRFGHFADPFYQRTLFHLCSFPSFLSFCCNKPDITTMTRGRPPHLLEISRSTSLSSGAVFVSSRFSGGSFMYLEKSSQLSSSFKGGSLYKLDSPPAFVPTSSVREVMINLLPSTPSYLECQSLKHPMFQCSIYRQVQSGTSFASRTHTRLASMSGWFSSHFSFCICTCLVFPAPAIPTIDVMQ